MSIVKLKHHQSLPKLHVLNYPYLFYFQRKKPKEYWEKWIYMRNLVHKYFLEEIPWRKNPISIFSPVSENWLCQTVSSELGQNGSTINVCWLMLLTINDNPTNKSLWVLSNDRLILISLPWLRMNGFIILFMVCTYLHNMFWCM